MTPSAQQNPGAGSDRPALSMIERLSKPAILDVRISALVNMYVWRIRRYGMQELLAGTGIAIGVALMLAVLVASTSITSSAGQTLHSIIGSARLQLVARSPAGFDEDLAERVGRLPGVKVAAPLLRENAMILGPKGRQSIQLVGLAPSQVALKGTATLNLAAGSGLLAGGLGLPSSVAGQIGANASEDVTLIANGKSHRVDVRAVLGSQAVGPIAYSPIAVALLPVAQRLAGEHGRVTQVLIVPEPGTDRQVAGELRHMAAGRLDVTPASHELSVLDATSQPTSQSSKLFAVIGAMVGFLFAANAMLLTVPERRRLVAELSKQGYGPRQIVLILAFQAVALGVIASLAGVVLGGVLARTLFSAVPSYLTLAFPIGTHPVIPLATIMLALGAGVLATLLASAAPIRDLFPKRPIDAVLHTIGQAGQSVSTRTTLTSAAVGTAIVAAVTLLVVVAPSLSVVGGVVLGVAVICLIPAFLILVVGCLTPLSDRIRGSMLAIGLIELDGTATRSIALAGVAGLAIYGSVAVDGARHDLVRGLDAAVVQYLDTAEVWVTATGDSFLTVDAFNGASAQTAIAHAPGIASVRSYQGALLDVGTRRLWIRARPTGDRTMIQASQLMSGSLPRATRLISQGGWAAISNGFATERHLRVGDTFTLPTPSGSMPLRIAAITTNVGWPPGAITINTTDYRHWWQTANPTALEVNLHPGVGATAGKLAVEHALGSRPGLLVQTLGERESQYEQSARQGVKSLSEISTLVLIAAALAIACALSATISARRIDIAARKTEGYDTKQLWRSLLYESAIVLSIGCLDGVILGVYGHALASRWLRVSQGFPAPFSPNLSGVLLVLAIISSIALAIIAVFGLRAARVPPRLSLQE
jgi:putative ABC transport system permease protein